MIREVNIKCFFDIDDKLVITNPYKAEDIIYNDIINIFADNEGFQGLRVDCKDYIGKSAAEIKPYLERYVCF